MRPWKCDLLGKLWRQSEDGWFLVQRRVGDWRRQALLDGRWRLGFALKIQLPHGKQKQFRRPDQKAPPKIQSAR